MKVLMVISQFNPIIGGAEKQAQLLAKKLIEKGIQVNVLTGWWYFRTPRRETIDGIKVYRNLALWGPFGIAGRRSLKKLGALVYMLSVCTYLLIHRHEYDLIHVHQALHPAFVCVFMGKFLRKPVIVKTASSGATSDINHLRRVPFGGFQLRYLLKHTDYLVSVSKLGRDEFIKAGFPQAKIECIPNGVILAADRMSNLSEVKQVLTIARLSKEKGINILLKAWAKIAEDGKGLKLTIVGAGPLAAELKQLSISLGVNDSVEFMGMLEDPTEFFKKAHFFVLPSRSEGLSNALLEAMSHGLPCIATNVGGSIELIGEDHHQEIMPGEFMVAKNGLLVNPDDVEGISKAMAYLIQNTKEREEIGNNGRLHVGRHYSIDLIANQYITLYQRMLGEKS